MHIADPANRQPRRERDRRRQRRHRHRRGVRRRRCCGSGQVAVCFFGEGALGQGLLYEEMNLAHALEAARSIYVCENNLYNEYTHFHETTAGDDRRRVPTAFGHARRARSTARTCARCTQAALEASRAGARAATAPAFLLVQHLPLSRPPRRRRRPRVLPVEAKKSEPGATRARSDRAPRRLAARAGPRRRGRRSTRSEANVTARDGGRRRSSRSRRPYPDCRGSRRGRLCLAHDRGRREGSRA